MSQTVGTGSKHLSMTEPSADRIFGRSRLELVFARDTVLGLERQLFPLLEARLPLSVPPTCASGVTACAHQD